MVNYEIIDKEKNIAMLSFSTLQMPVFKENKKGGWIDCGTRNDFPNQLLRLYEEHEEHGAIISAKSNYLFGKGFKAIDEAQQAIVDQFFTYANRYESWETVNAKSKIDCELFNCTYLQVITDLMGKPKEYYHLQYSNVRINEDKNHIWYSSNFLDSKEHKSEFDIYDPLSNKPGVFFIRLEFYKPSQNKIASIYPSPQYIACIKSISTDIDISTFNNAYVANGFSAGTMITLFQAEPETAGAKRKLKEALLNTMSSPEKAGSIVLAWAGTDGQAPKIEALSVDDLDKKFEFTSKRCLDKIIRGHNVTNPELFGVKTEGQLGTRVSLKESYELMLNTYTKPRQNIVCSFYEYLIKNATGQIVKLEVDQLEAIGLDLTSDPDLTPDERRILKGYLPLTAPKLDANGQEIQASEVNSTLTNLTGRQFQGLMRIVSKFDSGKLSKESAIALMIASFGITKEDALTFLNENDNDVNTPLPVKMSSQINDFIIAQFEAIDTTSDLELELLSVEDAHIHNTKQALKHEFSMQVKFADTKEAGFLDTLVSGLLGKIGGGGGGGKKNIIDDDDPTYKTEILTKYKYALKKGAPALKGNSSRPFCTKMLALDKEFTFEQIDSVRLAGLSNGFPELDNIWEFRGGYYTKPNTNDTDPFCRHIWEARTYKVKTKI